MLPAVLGISWGCVMDAVGMVETWDTGETGWMAVRYEYIVPDGSCRFGYAETVEEAHAIVGSTIAGWSE